MKIKWIMTVAAVMIYFCVDLYLPEDVYSAQENFLDVSVTEIGTSETEAEGRDTEIEQRIARIRGTLPLPLINGDILILQAGWQVHDLDISKFTPVGSVTQGDLPDRLYAGDIGVGLMHKFSGSWSGLARIAPGIRSDMEDIDEKDIYWSGHISFLYSLAGDGHIGLGAGFSDDFGSPQAFPMLHLKLRPTDRWEIDGVLPVNFTAACKLNHRMKAGLDFQVVGNQYRLTEDAPWDGSVLNYKQMLAGPFIDFELHPRARVVLKGGVVFNHTIEFRDSDDTDDVISETDFEDTTFMNINFYVPF